MNQPKFLPHLTRAEKETLRRLREQLRQYLEKQAASSASRKLP